MNERDTVDLLERLADTVEVGQAPIGRIAADGRRRVRGRRRWQVTGAAVVVSMLIATGALISRGGPVAGPAGSPGNSSPTAPTTAPTEWRTASQTAGNGIVTVPDVIGLSQTDAARVLKRIGLTTQACQQPDLCPIDLGGPHRVLGQDPAPGTKQDEGSVVTLTVEPVSSDLSNSDVRVAQVFASFALGEQAIGPFDTPVGLGVLGSFVRSVDPTSPASEWALPPPRGTGISGTLSALGVIKQYDGNLQVTSDRHVVCATRPATGPSELTGGGHLVSIQPRGSESCLQWFSVDLYVNDVGQVVGVDLRVGIP